MRLFFLPDKLLHILINTSSSKRFLLLGGMGALILGIPLGIFASLSLRNFTQVPVSTSSSEDGNGLAVLAAETKNPNFVFNVNVPSFFSDDVTVKGSLTVQGKAVFADGIDLQGTELDLGTGTITASNILYSLSAGDGITISDGQEPTITNSGVLSLQGKTGALSLKAGSGISIDGLKITATGGTQDLFKTISVSGQDDITAGSTTDTLTFAAGTGITVTTDSSNKIVTIASSGGGSSGVTSLDSLTGGITISNTSGSGSTITIDDATTAAKGIASFNSANFSVSSGAVNLVQNIGTSASPSFTGLTLSGLTTTGGLLYTNGSGVLAQLSAGTSGYVLTSGGSGSAPSWQSMTSSQWTTTGSDIYYNTGNIAIGTTSTSSRFDLKSSNTNTDVQRWVASDGSRLGRFTETSGGAGWFEVDNASGTAQALLRGDGGDSYLLSGNFGIGTSSPVGLLNVSGGVTGKALTVLNVTNTQDILAASSSGATKFRVNNSGQLYLADGSAPSSTTNMLYPVSGTLYWNGSAISGLTSSQWTTSSSNIYYSSGNVGIGTTSVSNQFTINGLTTADSNAVFALGTGGISNKGLVIQGYSGQGSNLQEWQSSAGVLLSGIDANGLFKAYDTSVIPSYGNSGGTGNRTSSITVTGVQCCYNNSLSEGVDGTTTAQSGFGFWEYNGGSAFNVANDSITFDFTSAKLITEVTLYMYGPASTSQGTWKWQGSNNGSSFTDIGGNFSITTTGSVSQIVITTLSGNATSYRYYRMQGVSGQLNGGVSNNGQNHSFDEFNFKIASTANSVNTTIAYNYIDMGGSSAGTHALTISTAKTGKALVVFNETGNNDILAASTSGTTKFRINNSGQLYIADGSAPSSTTNMLYAVSGGLYWNGTQLNTGVVAYLGLNSGALAPLNATVDLLLGGTASTSAKFGFLNVNTGTPIASISANSGNNGIYITGDGSIGRPNRGDLTIGNSSTYNTTGNVLINSNGTGNVGIGTTAPSAYLHTYVNGSVSAANILAETTTTTSYAMVGVKGSGREYRVGVGGGSESGYGVANKFFVFDSTGNAMRMTIDTNGNVGIGTTSPTAGVFLSKSLSSQSDPASGLAAFYNTNTTSTAHSSLLLRTGSSAGGDPFVSFDIANEFGWALGVDNSDSNKFKINPSWSSVDSATVFTIDTSGNIGVGTTGPGNKLSLNAPATVDGTALALFTAGSASQKPLVLQGYSGQTANLQEWQVSDGSILASIGSTQATFNENSSIAYGNSGGTGNRTSSITVTTNMSTGAGNVTNLVNGTTGDSAWFSGNGAASGNYVQFNFGNGASKVITEAKFYQQCSCGSFGTWKWRGSNDGSSWTDIGSSFSWGGSTTQTMTSLSGNTTGYQYYRIEGVSGSGGTNYWMGEFEFKIGNASINGSTVIAGGLMGVGTSVLTHKLNISGTVVGKALVMLNDTGTNDLFTASASGITKFTINNSGQLYMASGTAPGVTTNMLYANSGNLYWAGTQITGSGGGLSQWTTTGSNIYYNSGNVGIGTTSPLGLLNVEGGPIGKSLLILNQTGNQAILSASVSGATKFIVDNSGNVGIGTSAPATAFHVYAAVGGNAGAIIDQRGTNSPDIFTASSSGTTRFTIANSGNIGINTTSVTNPITVGTDNTNGNGANLSAGGSWNNGSSREFKENFQMIDQQSILEKINSLSIQQWNYNNEQDSVKHIGPIAEDFYNTFHVGNDNKHISTIDPAGVALVGIQALSKQLEELRSQVGIASFSASFVSSESLDLNDTNANLSGSLTVLGRTILTDLGVTGNITSGLMNIDGAEGSINVVGDLKLQSNRFGKIDLFAGKVTVDNKGNIITAGTVTAKEVVTEKLTLTTHDSSTSAVLSASAGKITIPAGKTSVDVKTTALTDDSLIFVTPENPVSIAAIKKDSQVFTIKLDESQSTELKVGWWIVDATSN